MCLVEPDLLAGFGMGRQGLADLPRPEPPLLAPFVVETELDADPLGLRAILGLEHVLPRQIEVLAIVTDIQHTLRSKLFPRCRRQPPQDSTAVRERGRATLLGREHAEEPDLPWPLPGVG